MKAFLLASMALFAMNASVHANEVDQVLEQLAPAEELSMEDRVDENAIDEILGDIEVSEMDDSLFPPYHPRPRPPYPRPPHHPHPGHPGPPPAYRYECSSSDRFNRLYVGRGRNPVRTQRLVHDRCEYDSRGYCYDNGCRRIR